MRRGASFPARWRESQPLRHRAGTVCGFAATVFFALYNGALWLYYTSPWHGSICVYYLLLSLLRGLLLAAEHRRAGGGHTAPGKQRWIVYLSSAMLLLLNVALAVPISLMVLDQRDVRMGLIPAITTATYTTYKIAAASVKLKRAGASPFVRQLERLRFVDALVSILVLQNTLITAVEGQITSKMFYLCAISSAAIFLAILALSVRWLLRVPKEA